MYIMNDISMLYLLQDNAVDTTVTAKSFQWTSEGEEYGTFFNGLRVDPNADDQTNKATCLLFKCPG